MHNPRKFRLARTWSNVQLRRIAALVSGDIVNVSAGEDVDKQGSHYADYFSGADSYSLTNYKSGSFRGFQSRENEYQLDLTESLPEELRQRFDVALNHTTLEHVFDVTTAFANLCAMSRDLVIVVVPFCQQQHEEPDYGDYWRFTPSCLEKLFELNDMEVVYEAANNDFNVASYLISVGSKHPQRWYGVMPESEPIYPAASWVGDSPWKHWKQQIRTKLRLVSRGKQNSQPAKGDSPSISTPNRRAA